jgi:hypothetical protein
MKLAEKRKFLKFTFAKIVENETSWKKEILEINIC